MTQQLTLELQPGITTRHRSLLQCIAACIYQKGLSDIAIDLNKSPGNLSVELAGDKDRHFSVENLELYMQKTGDLTPLHYLISRYLGDQSEATDSIQRRVEALLAEAVQLQREAANKGGKQALRAAS